MVKSNTLSVNPKRETRGKQRRNDVSGSWNDHEKEILKSVWNKHGNDVLAMEDTFGRHYATICSMAAKMGLKNN